MNLIFLGDSLMQPNGMDTYPQKGWPQMLDPYLADPEETKVLDFALNGRSTKSFLDEGRFKEALDAAKDGDVCFISFGHNDEKIEDPKRYTTPYGTYIENLAYMESEMKKKGVRSIFLTSVTRLKYDENGLLLHTHKEYPTAMKELAEKLHDPLIDLENLTYDDLQKHTKEENSKYYMILKPGEFETCPEGKKDTTHMRVEGAKWICSLVVPEMKKIPFVASCFK